MFWGSCDTTPLRKPADWVESVKGVADELLFLLVAATFLGKCPQPGPVTTRCRKPNDRMT